MLRKLVVFGAGIGVGYMIGVRAGFDAAVRDYLENSGQLLEKVADSKNKFDTSSEVADDDEEDSTIIRTGFQ